MSVRAIVVCMTMLLFPLSAAAQDAEQAIRNQIGAFGDAFNAGDAAKMGELYTEDAVALPPGAEAIQGREAIRQFWQGALGSGLKNLSITPTEIEVRDDLAYEMSNFAFDIPAQGGGTDRAMGKYIVIWKRGDDGTWRLHRDIWNMNAS